MFHNTDHLEKKNQPSSEEDIGDINTLVEETAHLDSKKTYIYGVLTDNHLTAPAERRVSISKFGKTYVS